MDFPSVGDAITYRVFGETCAAYFLNPDTAPYNCYNGIRPVGIMIFQALPFLFTSDPVKADYISLFLNILCLIVIIKSVVVIFRNLNDSMEGKQHKTEKLLETGLVILTALLCTAYIPVRSSDIQSLAFFVSSIAIVSNKNHGQHFGMLILAGVLAGISVLLKQNYVASIFFLVFFWVISDFRNLLENRFKRIFGFLLGSSVCLVQVAFVFHNSAEGTLWFYEPKYMETYAEGNAQPYVELIAFSKPVPGAYLTTLQERVSTLDFIAIRFYEGVSKFYWTMYANYAPTDDEPVNLFMSAARILFIKLMVFLSLAGCLATYCFKNKWLFIISFTALASGIMTASIMHTENRYYVMTKLLYALVAVAAVNLLMKKNGLNKNEQ
ncbi:hypothetical protein ACX64O_12685 [Pseudomonas fitomaticsae]